MESYILRIYRREGKSEGQMLGTVEDMQREGQIKFKNFAELKEILQKGEGMRGRLPVPEHIVSERLMNKKT